MHYDGSLPCQRAKNESCQVIKVRPAHRLKVFQLSPNVNFYHILP